MEEVLFKFERRTDRATVADLLRSVADNLDAGEPVTLAAGDESFTVNVPARPEFEVKVERETGSGSPELSVEFELEWDEDGTGDAELSVE
jgi:amphi-Trp domain-containing protein